MSYFKLINKVSLLLAFFIQVNTAFAQLATTENSEYLPVDSLINRYEKLKGIRIFYQPEWFENKKVHISTLNFSLDEFLYKLTQSGKCSLIAIDSASFVLVLPQVATDLSKDDVNTVILIGKMQDFGKFKKATIGGKIVDGKNGDPLPGASLFIEKLNARCTSDKNGNFSMEIPVGEYEVKLNFVGYQETSRKIKLVSPGRTNFELFEKSVNLNEVVVTSERAEQNVSRTQMSLVKMDAKTIKELPVSLGEVDILKSVTLLPGIQSTGEFGTGFFVRGGGADQNLILLEDEPVFNSSHLFGLTSIVNPDGIANVTLYKGGIPAKFGERASSVLDIRLGSSNQDESKVKGSIGLINSKINLDIPIAKNKANLFLGGRTTYSDWLLHKTSDIDLMNSSARFSDLNALLVYNLNKNNKITLFGYYSKDRFKISNSDDYSYYNTISSVRWNHIFSRNISSVFVTGFSKYDYDMSEVDSTQRDESYKLKSSLLYKNVKYNVNWTPGHSHSVDFGVNGIFYNENPGELSPYDSVSLVSPIKIAKEKALEYGIYVSDNISFTDKLGVEVGLRYSGYEFLGSAEVYSYESNQPKSKETIYDTVYYGNNKKVAGYSGFEPRISARFTIDDKSSVKASYNRINQYINLISNTTVSNPSDIWKLSDKYVKPLVCDQYALGYFRNFKSNMFETSVELYYKNLKNIIEYKDGASLAVNPTLDADLLNAKGYNYGMELYLKKSTGRLTGWLTYTYSRSMRHTYSSFSSEQVNDNAYFPSVYDKPHNFNWVGNYHISRRWRFSWSFSYSTGRPVTLPEYKYYVGNYELVYYSDRNKYRLPDYHRLDISITRDETLKLKKFWKGSWTFAIINVYGRKNYYSTYLDREGTGSDLYALYIIGRPLPTLTYNFSF